MGYSHLCDDYEPEELVCITSHDDKDYYSMDDFYDLDELDQISIKNTACSDCRTLYFLWIFLDYGMGITYNQTQQFKPQNFKVDTL